MSNIIIIVIVGAIVLLFFAGIRIVRPTHRALIERLGKYNRFAQPGFHWIIPGIENMYQVNITEKMITEALTSRMGPTHLDFPMDLQRKQIANSELIKLNRENLIDQQHFDAIDGFVNDILDNLRKSKRPILYIGNGCRNSKSMELLKSIINEFDSTAQLKQYKSKLFKSNEEFESFYKKFVDKGVGEFGSGWIWICKKIKENKLDVFTTHDSKVPFDDSNTKILGVVDLWEHAYYLDYPADRKKYLEESFKTLNWKNFL